MAGHQVPWQKNLTYEELLKQCPYLNQKAAESIDKGDAAKDPVEPFSKSKKKRLKKRLKATAQQNKEVHTSVGPPLLIENSNHMVMPSTDKNLKQESKTMPANEKQTKSSLQHEVSQPQTKSRISDTVDGEIFFSREKVSREGVLGERENKKKAKQVSKQQKKEINTVNPSSDKIVNKQSPSKQTSESKISNEPTNKPVKEEYLKRKENAPIASNSVQAVPVENKLSSADKSREEILAEREAKKKAKQMAKQKKGDAPVPQNASEAEKKDNKLNELSNGISEIRITTEICTKPEEIKPVVEKSKAQLRAERRAIQEAQRASKTSHVEKKPIEELIEKKQPVQSIQKSSPSKDLMIEVKPLPKVKTVTQQRIKLFSHLYFGQKASPTQLIQNVHPSVIQLGVKYATHIINGSNARCVALLNCLKEVIRDYSTPKEKEFSRGLESKLGELTNYLNQCRPVSVSMTNALRHIKSHLTQLPNNVTDDEAKRKLFDVIDTFIGEQIDVAGEAICEAVKNKITNGDVILIYSCSSLVFRILAESQRSGRMFRVIVVDGGPWFEGREMLRKLVSAGLKCTYVHLSAITFIIRQATKVLLGAHALLANGSVMSRAGTALVALTAHSYNVPVLVSCETYKFCERVQTDSFVYNELGRPDDLAKEDSRLSNWQSLTSLSPLSLVYDITPPDLVTAVVTEIAILPCTSVPVILRVKPSDLVL